MPIINFIVVLIVIVLLLGLLRYVLVSFPPPPPLDRFVDLILVIVGVLAVIYLLLSLVGAVPRLEFYHYP